MRFVIVTGLSGAGKLTALKFLEDSEYFCVDNLPIELLDPFAQISVDGSSSEINKIAAGIDIRSGLDEEKMLSILDSMNRHGIHYEILFLDASDEVLLKRYKESRRAHPAAVPGGRVEDGIRTERGKLKFLKERADFIIDTSQLLTRELRQEIRRIFVEDKNYKNLYITVLSFGFKYGIPTDSDLVFDVRFLPNPYYVDNLRQLTGNDAPVRDYVMSYEQSHTFLKKLTDLIEFLIPNYIAEGKNQLIVSIGCTGGRHRSVTLANALYEALAKDSDYGIRIEHRDIERDPVRKRNQ